MKAYAYVDKNGVIDINTVSDNVEKAQVNALVSVFNQTIISMGLAPTSVIHALFGRLALDNGCIKPVKITVIEH